MALTLVFTALAVDARVDKARALMAAGNEEVAPVRFSASAGCAAIRL